MALGFGADLEQKRGRTPDVDVDRFITELLRGRSAFDAIVAAGFPFDGSTEARTKATHAAYNLRRTKWVAAELGRRHDELMRRTELPTNDTIEHEFMAHTYGEHAPEHRLKALTAWARFRLRSGSQGAKALSEHDVWAKLQTLVMIREAEQPTLPAVEPELTEEQLLDQARQDAIARARKDKR